jgi:hypothetical protein
VIEEIMKLMLRSAETASKERLSREEGSNNTAVAVQKQQQEWSG